MIRVVHLSKSFGRTRALEDVSFCIGRGEKVLLLGPNGAGKTTLLRILAGLISPTSGEIHIPCDGQARGSQERALLIGYVGHQCMLYEELTPEENLRFYGTLYGLPGTFAADRATALIRMVEMEGHRKVSVKLLSQGQRKRISIARALVHDPPILLLDEPFSALDAGARSWLGGLLSIALDKTVLLATHQPERDYPSAHRALVLIGGILAGDKPIDGTPDSGTPDGTSDRGSAGERLYPPDPGAKR